MGNCYRRPATEMLEVPQYYSEVTLSVKSRDAGRSHERLRTVQVRLRPSQSVHSSQCRLSSLSLSLSSCVLPGCDPIENSSREGQDCAFCIESPDSLLVGLCDGHGKEGRKVVDFCQSWLSAHYREHAAEFFEAAEEAMCTAFRDCDAAVKREVECLLSGASAAVAVITERKVVVGSVGDAKIVLAAKPSLSALPPANSEIPTETKPPRRILAPGRLLDATQLTIDHKPNHSEELQRILESGGRVSRLTDDAGNKIGPHRVWKKNGHLPGLAASRSIGDKMASELGIVPTPLTHRRDLRSEDQFLVLASDGVWNVMSDEDVVNFCEKYRRMCIRVPLQKPVDPVKPTNATIAQLLAEEARQRWLRLVEAESVSVDDIACVVVELDTGGATPEGLGKEEGGRREVLRLGDVQEGEEDIHFSKSSDPLRGSIIIPSDADSDLLPPSTDEHLSH